MRASMGEIHLLSVYPPHKPNTTAQHYWMLSRQLSTNQKKCTNWGGCDVTIIFCPVGGPFIITCTLGSGILYLSIFVFVLQRRSWFLSFSPFISCILIIVPVPRHRVGNVLSSGSLEVTTRGEYLQNIVYFIETHLQIANRASYCTFHIILHIIYLQFTCLDFWWWEIKSQFHYKSFFQEFLSFTFSSDSV